MAIRFIPVSEINDPLTITLGISGGSGTGKTFTALLIGRGIAEVITGRKGSPIGYVDTEGKRALHYKSAFPEMHHFDFEAVDESGALVGFPPERWIEVIDAAEAAGISVLVADSFSHSWEGVGGVLDLHAQVLDRLVREAEARNARYNNTTPIDPGKYSQLAWAEVKPRYRRLIDRIVRAKTNIIICTRAKPVMQAGFGDKAKNARKTKTRRDDVPWDPATDADLMFEMAAMVILDPIAPGCPVHQIKVSDQFKTIFDKRRPMSEETGRAMAEWAKGQGGAQKQKEVMDLARDKARAGSAPFKVWWASDEGKAARQIVRPIMDDIQAICADADKEAMRSDDDPFEGPDDEQMGESHTGDDDPAWLATVNELRAQIEAADTKGSFDAADTEFNRISAGLPDDVVAQINASLTAKRKTLSKAA